MPQDQDIELLNSGRIRVLMDDSIAIHIREISIYSSLDSTNTWLMQQAENGAPSGSVCLAEQQTAGRGRHGRIWVSPPGGNLYLSLLWRYPMSPNQLRGLSLACAVAVVRALWQLEITGLTVKWPNDLLLCERKLAGLLLEVRGDMEGPSYIVIGLGLNVHLPIQCATVIEQPWIALDHLFINQARFRNLLVATILSQMTQALIDFGSSGLEPFLADWNGCDALYGKVVRLKIGNERIDGYYLGIDKDGGLRLVVNGIESFYYGGEVSLL